MESGRQESPAAATADREVRRFLVVRHIDPWQIVAGDISSQVDDSRLANRESYKWIIPGPGIQAN
jgi:hypothetical protein